MKLIGKFKKYERYQDKVKIRFYVKENILDVMKSIGTLIEYPLKIALGHGNVFDAEIGYFYGKQYYFVIDILIRINRKSMEMIGALADRMISIEIHSDKSHGKNLEKINPAFFNKIRATIHEMAEQTGYKTNALQTTMCNLYQPSFRLNSSTYQVDGESYYEFLKQYAMEYGIAIKDDAIDVVGAFLKKCWKAEMCAVCYEPIVKNTGLYPLCQKHYNEFLENQEKFDKKYHF